MESKPILEFRQIVKRFPGVEALKGVDLDLYDGEVHILVGANGAGKSTLVKILAGVYQPDGGEIFLVVNLLLLGAPSRLWSWVSLLFTRTLILSIRWT